MLRREPLDPVQPAHAHVNQGDAPPPEIAHLRVVEAPCAECGRILDALRQHVGTAHADGPVALQKAAVRAWFECHYSLDSDNADDGVAVSRKTLLDEINAFLASMQWPTWKAQSAMYDWFLREVMGLSDHDIRKGRNWVLHYRDGFAPGGNQGNARNQQQRFEALVRKYMQMM